VFRTAGREGTPTISEYGDDLEGDVGAFDLDELVVAGIDTEVVDDAIFRDDVSSPSVVDSGFVFGRFEDGDRRVFEVCSLPAFVDDLVACLELKVVDGLVVKASAMLAMGLDGSFHFPEILVLVDFMKGTGREAMAPLAIGRWAIVPDGVFLAFGSAVLAVDGARALRLWHLGP
jgi:hypothetical protein